MKSLQCLELLMCAQSMDFPAKLLVLQQCLWKTTALFMSICTGMLLYWSDLMISILHCASLLYNIIRNMMLQFGMWDQIRADQGKEWNLLLYINQSLSHLRNDPSRPPHLQSSSKLVCGSLCLVFKCAWALTWYLISRITLLNECGWRLTTESIIL